MTPAKEVFIGAFFTFIWLVLLSLGRAAAKRKPSRDDALRKLQRDSILPPTRNYQVNDDR